MHDKTREIRCVWLNVQVLLKLWVLACPHKNGFLSLHTTYTLNQKVKKKCFFFFINLKMGHRKVFVGKKCTKWSSIILICSIVVCNVVRIVGMHRLHFIPRLKYRELNKESFGVNMKWSGKWVALPKKIRWVHTA